MRFCLWGSIAKGLDGNPVGGGEQQLALIAKYLNKLGHKVVIIDFDIARDTDFDGIEVLAIAARSKNRIANYFTLYKLLKLVEADVYYARIRSSIHLLALLTSKINNSIFIYHLASDLDSLNFKSRWRGLYSKLLSPKKIITNLIHSELLFHIVLKNASLLITQNSEQYQNLKIKGFQNVCEIKNLFEFIPHNYTKDAPNKKREYFMYIGSLDLRKGVKELQIIIDANPSLNFYILGKARDKAGLGFVNNMKFRNNVNILGHQPHNKVLEHLNGALGLISTSIYEGFSNAFIEAWSLGVPVLSLNSNPSNVLNDYNLGRFYSSSIERMINDIKDFNSIQFDKNEIMDYVKTNHDPLKNTNRIIQELEQLY